jgi:hypothetical protein
LAVVAALEVCSWMIFFVDNVGRFLVCFRISE